MKYSFFEESIHHHTRAQAVANGEQVEVSSIASQASIPFPVFLTRRVFDAYVTLPPNGRAPTPEHDAARRLSDILWMLHVAMLDKTAKGRSRLAFTFHIHYGHRAPRLIKLVARCGALDISDPQPAITVMMPNED